MSSTSHTTTVSAPQPMVTRHLRVFGKVQGVWYRESMRIEAERLGVTGWVRNRLDGSVEALIQGKPNAVDQITSWARRGPMQAQVTHIEIDENVPKVGLNTTRFDTFLKLGTT